MAFKAPGSGAPPQQQSDGFKVSDLEGCTVVLTNIEHGESVTEFSDGKPKAHVDADVYALDGPEAGQKRRSRWFGGYIVSDLRGLKFDDQVLGKIVKGAPRAGLREGWLLTEVTDPRVVAAAEVAFAGTKPPF